jgi:hypothetical protein
MTAPAVAGLLNSAADLVERDGLNKDGHMWSRPGGINSSTRCLRCAYGAILAAGDGSSFSVCRAALRLLAEVVPTGVTSRPIATIARWSDDPDTTQAEVAARLREAARAAA